MNGILLSLLRPAIKLVLLAALAYVVAVLPALLWVQFVDPRAEQTNRPFLYSLIAVWDVTLVGAFVLSRWGSLLRWRRRRARSGAHGTAEWDDGKALATSRAGRLIGRANGRMLRYAGDGHLLTVAPTRSGKGVSTVIPNLLDHPGSVLVTDIKGENYAVSMARRAIDLGQAVHALDPFGVVGGTATFNPLLSLEQSPADAADDAAMIADMLVVGDASHERSGERFWDEEARALLSGLILFASQQPEPRHRTLLYVRERLTGAPAELSRLWAEMCEAEGEHAPLIRRAGARILQKADRERAGVISSAQSHTHFLDSPRMERVLAESSFSFADLKRSRASVYLVLPPDRLDSYRRWLRLMIAIALRECTRTPGRPAERVLFVLDEFPHLGPMGPVAQAISLLAGYGVSLWPLIQDLSQLRATYPTAWSSFLANVDVLQAFGTADQPTAELLSKMTGQATVVVESANESSGRSHGDFSLRGNAQRGSSMTLSETGRPLLLPDEVRRLPPGRQLLFVKGRGPILCDRLNYLEDPEFAGLYAANPMHESAPHR